MTPSLRLARFRRLIAVTAIAAVLGVLGFGAAEWFVHEHDSHGWHAHAGEPVPESPLDGHSEDIEAGEHEHGVAASVELIGSIPATRRISAPHPSELDVVAAAVVTQMYGAPPTAHPAHAAAWWHPPPPLLADSGTSRVLRTSHALLF